MKWNPNGVELELEIDMEDAEFQLKYEQAFEKMIEYSNTVEKTVCNLLSQQTELYCNAFYKFFDDLFGNGTGQKIFKGKHNSRICDEIYSEFIGICNKQSNDARQRRANMMQAAQKYVPRNKYNGKK